MLLVNSLSLALRFFPNKFFKIFVIVGCCFSTMSQCSNTFPKEIVRHIFQNVNPHLQGAHVALPDTIVQNRQIGEIVYFSFNSADLKNKSDGENSQIVEIIEQNREKVRNNENFLWIVSPGSGKGRGLMWKKCELSLSAKRRRKGVNNNKERWNFFRLKQPSCLIDLLENDKITLQVYAAISNGRPKISARQAKIFLKEKSREPEVQRQRIRANRHPTLLLVSYYSSSLNNDSEKRELSTVKLSSPPAAATVSTQYAIDFLLGRHDEQRVLRLTRALPMKPRSKNTNEKLPSPSSFQAGLSPHLVVPNLCKRQPLLTKVEDVGLQSYIVYPRQFDIGQCSGACIFPLTHEVDPRTHTVIQLLHHLAVPDRIPAPNCVPVSFKPVSILVRKTDNSLALETFNDLVVQSCGCR